MKLYITTLALLALQNTNVSADTSSTISDLTSRLESIKNAASAMVEEISQKESELMNEEFASQKENELMNEIVSEPKSDVMYESMEQKKSKLFDVIDTIPDNEVNDKVHKLMDMGFFSEAQHEVHNFLDEYIAQANSEKKDVLQANKDQIMRLIDEGFEEMLSEEEKGDMEELEFEDTGLEGGNSTFLTYQQAKQLIDDIPDKEVNENVHKLIEEGDAAGAEEVIHKFFDEYVDKLEDETAKSDMIANKDSIIVAVDKVVEAEAAEKSYFEKEEEAGNNSGGAITFTPAEAKAMIMSIPNETVKTDVLEKIAQKDVVGADKAIDDFFTTYIEGVTDETVKEQLEAETDALLSALHSAVEEWDDIEDEVSEDSEYEESEVKTMLDAQDKTEFEEKTNVDTQDEMRKVLDEIAENQLLIEEALEKLGGN